MAEAPAGNNVCPFCMLWVPQHDETAWKQVKGWIHGPKANGLTLREYTDVYAHDACVNKARAGQAADQLSLMDEDDSIISVRRKDIPTPKGVVAIESTSGNNDLAEELFGEKS